MPHEDCPACHGRRLSATWEERKETVGGVLFVGMSRVVLCKTCKHKIRDPKDVSDFAAAVERAASGKPVAADAIHKIEHQMTRVPGLWAFARRTPSVRAHVLGRVA